jgi:protein TonB
MLHYYSSSFVSTLHSRFGILLAVALIHGLAVMSLVRFAPQKWPVPAPAIEIDWLAPVSQGVASPARPPAKAMEPPPMRPLRPAAFVVDTPSVAEPVSAPAPQTATAIFPAQNEAVTKAAPAEPAPIQAPRFDAAYLQNPAPAYPPVSRRLGEEGRVLLRVLVSEAGRAERVEINQSSGSARLDEAAREAVRAWRFVPARQGERNTSAWVIVPIHFSLQG